MEGLDNNALLDVWGILESSGTDCDQTESDSYFYWGSKACNLLYNFVQDFLDQSHLLHTLD